MTAASASLCGVMDQAASRRSSHGGEKRKVKHVGMALAEGHALYSTDVASCCLGFHGWINSILQACCRRAELMASWALQRDKGASTTADHKRASNLTPKCEQATSHPALLGQICGQTHYKLMSRDHFFVLCFFPDVVTVEIIKLLLKHVTRLV